MKDRDQRNIIIGVLCAAILVMGVGFAYLSTALTINGTATVTNATWDVQFTNIAPVASPTTANASNSITDSGHTANLNVLLTKPGDTVTYTLTITNNGTLDATVANVAAQAPTASTGNEAIVFTYDNIEDEIITANGGTKTMTVTFTYDADASNAAGSEVGLADNTAVGTPLEYTITFDCVQATE